MGAGAGRRFSGNYRAAPHPGNFHSSHIGGGMSSDPFAAFGAVRRQSDGTPAPPQAAPAPPVAMGQMQQQQAPPQYQGQMGGMPMGGMGGPQMGMGGQPSMGMHQPGMMQQQPGMMQQPSMMQQPGMMQQNMGMVRPHSP